MAADPPAPEARVSAGSTAAAAAGAPGAGGAAASRTTPAQIPAKKNAKLFNTKTTFETEALCKKTVLRIRDVYPNFSIPGPDQGSKIFWIPRPDLLQRI